MELSTPRMMTWGISDFYDKEKNTHDGKFSLTLNFPNPEYETPETTLFLQKLQEFNEALLDCAFENKDKWFEGQDVEQRRDLQVSMYPVLKYPKNPVTKKVDKTRSPSITAKVEQDLQGNWKPRIFNTKRELIFPSSEHPDLTPADFVPKLSNVSCTIECSGIWMNAKSWGVTWRLKQCVVKPPDAVSSNVCQVFISPEDTQFINNQSIIGNSDNIEIDVDTATAYKVGETNLNWLKITWLIRMKSQSRNNRLFSLSRQKSWNLNRNRNRNRNRSRSHNPSPQ